MYASEKTRKHPLLILNGASLSQGSILLGQRRIGLGIGQSLTEVPLSEVGRRYEESSSSGNQ